MLQQPQVSPPKHKNFGVGDDLLRLWVTVVLLLIFSLLWNYAISCLVEQARDTEPQPRRSLQRRPLKRPTLSNTSPPFSSDVTSSLRIPLEPSFPRSPSPGVLRRPSVPEGDWVVNLKRLSIEIFSFDELAPCLGERLGSGAYGAVVTLSGKFSGYCLKMFTPLFLQNHQDFMAEVIFMHRLAHLKIPRLKGVCLHPKGIIMSRHQSTLMNWIVMKRPQPTDALDALIQLCHIVNDLHSEGFCHNDLKSNNVMIDQTENGIEVIVIDFGLTARIGDRPFYTGHSLTVGEELALLASLGYRSFYAPRLYIGGRCSPSTDAYALAHIAKWVLIQVNLTGQSRLQRLLDKYLKSCGDNCSIGDILHEMQVIRDGAQGKTETLKEKRK